MGFKIKVSKPKITVKAPKVVKQVANAAVKTATGGSLSVDGSGWAEKIAKGEEVGAFDLVQGVPGVAPLAEIAAATQPVPELPEMEDPDEQLKDAARRADDNLVSEIGSKPAGLSSTILGGSLSTDQGILKKRKLLG